MWFLALVSCVLSGVLLGLSAFPGVLEQVPFGPAVGGGLALVAAAVVLVCAAVTPYLLLTDVPRRALFGRYRGRNLSVFAGNR